jgi:hypothetical protein
MEVFMEQRTYLAFLITSGHSPQPTFKPSTAPAAPPYYIVAAKRKALTEKLANMPANQLYSLLFSIEQATVAIARKHTRLTDKEVEAVYLSYRDYFKAVRSGKDLEPPTSTISMKDDLFNEIWEVLLMREDNGYDEQFCDGSWSPGGTPITSVEQLYIMAFNEVRKSVRFWRLVPICSTTSTATSTRSPPKKSSNSSPGASKRLATPP